MYDEFTAVGIFSGSGEGTIHYESSTNAEYFSVGAQHYDEQTGNRDWISIVSAVGSQYCNYALWQRCIVLQLYLTA